MIQFDSVSKSYPKGAEAVRDLSMEVVEGETLVLLGTSGSGKTTTLKMVNRLIEPSRGRILIEGSDIMGQDPIGLRRKIGYAIQHIGLFPHMTVGENIAVVPKLLNWTGKRIAERIERLLTMVGLEPEEFRDRFPSQLSGGQRQRVGVARALGADPPIVLMDEPFGALDPITREQLQTEFTELQSKINKTIIFVTHDVFEAVKMGDRIALMDAGRLRQIGTPSQIIETPANEFVVQFLGKHRFQLALLTRSVDSLVETGTQPEDPDRYESVFKSESITAALDAFNRTSRDKILVYDENREYMGNLRRERLRGAVAEAIEGGGADQGEEDQ